MRNKRFWIVGILAISLLSAACAKKNDTPAASGTPTASPATPTQTATSGDSDEVSPGNVNPCPLLTAQEVAVAIEREVEEGRYNDDLGNGTCSWKLVEAEIDTQVSVTHWSDVTRVQESIDQQKETWEEVAGVGDKAYWHPSLTVLTFFKGEKAWDIQFAGEPGFSKEAGFKVAKALEPKV